jgi:hypothetical protein
MVQVQCLIVVFSIAYATTTRDQDCVKMEGLKQLVSDREHRQEIVANGLGSYLTFRAFAVRLVHHDPRIYCSVSRLSRRLGNRVGEFWNLLIYQHLIDLNERPIIQFSP